MSFITKTVKLFYRMYDFIMTEWTDPKTKSWIINKPPILAGLLIPYCLFCTIIGPRFMRNREPYNIKKLIHVYNISQIIINTAIVIIGYYRTRHYSFWCQPLDFGTNPKELAVSNIVWWYTASKLYDLLDTVFFVLRKNFRQVTPLHLYHHVLMGGGFNFATNFLSSGMVVLPFGMNALVHMFMYTYYFIAALGPEYQKYLWWKRHLTELQLLQFTIALFQFVYAFCISCDIPLGVNIYMVVQSVTFLILFGDFYYNAYIKREKPAKSQTDPQPGKEMSSNVEVIKEVNGDVEHIEESNSIKEVNGNVEFIKDLNGNVLYIQESSLVKDINGNVKPIKIANGNSNHCKESNGNVNHVKESNGNVNHIKESNGKAIFINKNNDERNADKGLYEKKID